MGDPAVPLGGVAGDRRRPRHQRLTPGRRRLLLPFIYFGSAIWHLPSVVQLWNAPDGSLLQRFLSHRSELWSMLRVRFVATLWPARERFARIVDHLRVVEQLGRPFDIGPRDYAMLLPLDDIRPGCGLMLDCPRWLMREGLLALSLLQDRERMFTIAFVLAWKDGQLSAYVGGIQGRRGAGVLADYRQFTKLACGARPQDLLVEAFRMLCAHIGVARIYCVSDAIRNGKAAPDERAHPISLDYDALWEARGGKRLPDGFYELATVARDRPAAEIPANRRTLRKRRQTLFRSIGERLGARLDHPGSIPIHEHDVSFP